MTGLCFKGTNYINFFFMLNVRVNVLLVLQLCSVMNSKLVINDLCVILTLCCLKICLLEPPFNVII